MILEQVKVIVDEDGATTVGNYKLGKSLINLTLRDLQGVTWARELSAKSAWEPTSSQMRKSQSKS